MHYSFPGGSDGRRLPTARETWVQSLGQEDLLEKAMAPHSSVLAWKIPWTEEPGGLQSVGLQSQTRLTDFTFTFIVLYNLNTEEEYAVHQETVFHEPYVL